MLAAGIIALIALPVAGAYALAWVVSQAALSEAETQDFGKGKAAVQNDLLGGRSELGQRPSVLGSQTSIQVQNSTHLKPRFTTGQAAK